MSKCECDLKAVKGQTWRATGRGPERALTEQVIVDPGIRRIGIIHIMTLLDLPIRLLERARPDTGTLAILQHVPLLALRQPEEDGDAVLEEDDFGDPVRRAGRVGWTAAVAPLGAFPFGDEVGLRGGAGGKGKLLVLCRARRICRREPGLDRVARREPEVAGRGVFLGGLLLLLTIGRAGDVLRRGRAEKGLIDVGRDVAFPLSVVLRVSTRAILRRGREQVLVCAGVIRLLDTFFHHLREETIMVPDLFGLCHSLEKRYASGRLDRGRTPDLGARAVPGQQRQGIHGVHGIVKYTDDADAMLPLEKRLKQLGLVPVRRRVRRQSRQAGLLALRLAHLFRVRALIRPILFDGRRRRRRCFISRDRLDGGRHTGR